MPWKPSRHHWIPRKGKWAKEHPRLYKETYDKFWTYMPGAGEHEQVHRHEKEVGPSEAWCAGTCAAGTTNLKTPVQTKTYTTKITDLMARLGRRQKTQALPMSRTRNAGSPRGQHERRTMTCPTDAPT